jgi:hypothetical protein
MDITSMSNRQLFELFSIDLFGTGDLHMVSPVAENLWPEPAVAASSLTLSDYFEKTPLDQNDRTNFKAFINSIATPHLAHSLARLLTIAKFDIARNKGFLVEEDGKYVKSITKIIVGKRTLYVAMYGLAKICYLAFHVVCYKVVAKQLLNITGHCRYIM